MNVNKATKASDKQTEKAPTRKLGQGAIQAAWRQGLSELGTALKAFPDSIQVTEQGQIGTATPGTVYEQQGMHLQDASNVARGTVYGKNQSQPKIQDAQLQPEGTVHSEPLSREEQQEANAQKADAAKAIQVSWSEPSPSRQQEHSR